MDDYTTPIPRGGQNSAYRSAHHHFDRAHLPVSGVWRLLITFAILWVVMIVIWALGSPRGFFWPAWVIFGTGIALAFTGINAFGPRNKGISQAKIDEEMKKFDSDS